MFSTLFNVVSGNGSTNHFGCIQQFTDFLVSVHSKMYQEQVERSERRNIMEKTVMNQTLPRNKAAQVKQDLHHINMNGLLGQFLLFPKYFYWSRPVVGCSDGPLQFS